MKAMILAAGRGERMRPLTDHTPKPLLKAGGKQLIVWHIENLAKAGFTDIVINHAYLGHMIEAALGNGAKWGVSIQYSAEKTALETAGGIANALDLLTDNGTNIGPFLVVNGDTFTDFDFSQLIFKPKMLAHLVLVDNPPQHAKGDFAISGDCLKNDGMPMFTFSGIGLYHSNLFTKINRGEPAKLAPLLRQAIDKKAATAQYYQGIWHDIGTPERLHTLDNILNNIA